MSCLFRGEGAVGVDRFRGPRWRTSELRGEGCAQRDEGWSTASDLREVGSWIQRRRRLCGSWGHSRFWLRLLTFWLEGASQWRVVLIVKVWSQEVSQLRVLTFVWRQAFHLLMKAVVEKMVGCLRGVCFALLRDGRGNRDGACGRRAGCPA